MFACKRFVPRCRRVSRVRTFCQGSTTGYVLITTGFKASITDVRLGNSIGGMLLSGRGSRAMSYAGGELGLGDYRIIILRVRVRWSTGLLRGA